MHVQVHKLGLPETKLLCFPAGATTSILWAWPELPSGACSFAYYPNGAGEVLDMPMCPPNLCHCFVALNRQRLLLQEECGAPHGCDMQDLGRTAIYSANPYVESVFEILVTHGPGMLAPPGQGELMQWPHQQLLAAVLAASHILSCSTCRGYTQAGPRCSTPPDNWPST
jgi:hypothetical protein